MSSAPRPAVLRWSVSIALAGLVLLVGSLAVFVFTRAGQRVDATMQSSVSTLGLLQLHNQWIVSAITPGTLALATLLTVSVGLARRRWDAVAAALILLVGANVTTALMKQTIPRPDYGFGEPNSSPSGHATATLSVALALMLTLSPRWRSWLLPLLGFGAGLIGTGVVLRGSHRPGDYWAAIGVCAVWVALALLVKTLTWKRQAPASAVPLERWLLLGEIGVVVLVLLDGALGVRIMPTARGFELVTMLIVGLLMEGALIGLVAAVADGRPTTSRMARELTARHQRGTSPGLG